MDELLATIERMIESHDKFCREVSQKLDERNKALVDIDEKIDVILGVEK